MKPKVERNQEILRMVDLEGRNFIWISKQLGCTERNVRKIYHREKYYQKFPKYADKVRKDNGPKTAPVAIEEEGASER